MRTSQSLAGLTSKAFFSKVSNFMAGMSLTGILSELDSITVSRLLTTFEVPKMRRPLPLLAGGGGIDPFFSDTFCISIKEGGLKAAVSLPRPGLELVLCKFFSERRELRLLSSTTPRLVLSAKYLRCCWSGCLENVTGFGGAFKGIKRLFSELIFFWKGGGGLEVWKGGGGGLEVLMGGGVWKTGPG